MPFDGKGGVFFLATEGRGFGAAGPASLATIHP